MYLQAYIQNLAENGSVVTDKRSLSSYVNDLGPRSRNDLGPRPRNDLDLQYSHIFIDSISFRSQAAIVSEKSIFLYFSLQKRLSYKF